MGAMSGVYHTAKKVLSTLDILYPVLFTWKLKVKRVAEGTDGFVNIDYENLTATITLDSGLADDKVTEVCCHEWAHLMVPLERTEHGPLWGTAYGLCYQSLLD